MHFDPWCQGWLCMTLRLSLLQLGLTYGLPLQTRKVLHAWVMPKRGQCCRFATATLLLSFNLRATLLSQFAPPHPPLPPYQPPVPWLDLGVLQGDKGVSQEDSRRESGAQAGTSTNARTTSRLGPPNGLSPQKRYSYCYWRSSCCFGCCCCCLML